MKLGLGTVQFGLEYGISNFSGKTEREEAEAILTLAASTGIRVVDTASLYGDSERVLGGLLEPGHPFRVVTKSCKFGCYRITEHDAEELEKTMQLSLIRLRQPQVYGLLLHQADDLLVEGGSRLMERLLMLKERGWVQKVGVSAYTPCQVERVLERFPIDLIQLPVNVLDQRLLKGGQLAALKEAGVEVHARSAFLQGLLLMEPRTLPSWFEPVRPLLMRYHRYLAERKLSPVQAALGFVTALKELDVVVCGFNNHKQLEQACRAVPAVDPGEFDRFAVTDEAMLDPTQWRV